MRKTVDKTKKSNIKCEHCHYYDKDISFCCNVNSPRENVNYWNRCKFFEWLKEEQS